jgi:hypothetical protein
VNNRLVFFLLLAFIPSLVFSTADKEIPTFGLLINGGECNTSGFIPSFGPAPTVGLSMSYGFADRWDGLWSMDYYTLSNQPLTLFAPTPANSVAQTIVQPSDDVALSVNTRWYWWDKYDLVHQRFKWVPYLTGGIGLDLVVDEYPPPPGANFWSKDFDILLGMNLGAGVDIPLGDTWGIYGEALDHAIFWQGLTQVVVGRVGIKFMLDSQHVDPFR